MRNTAALGAVLGHMGFPLDYLTGSIEQQFAHKAPKIAEQNVACATAGYEHARDHDCAFPYDMQPRERDGDRILADGNEAVGAAAIAAGIGLYCAYPMTPASSLLHFFAKHGEKFDFVVKHTEDEIAAMNMVVGGAFGGTRSMCATSGGGFSLMVEAFGLAGVSESAVVVGLFTRPGPATGMPTWTEQSDLRFAIHASQGEFPRIVVAPGDREDAFHLTWQAFNLADVLQTPVIILGDTYLSDNRQSIPPFDVSRGRDRPWRAHHRGPGRGVRTVPGHRLGRLAESVPGVIGAEQVVNSYEHDEHGYGAPARRGGPHRPEREAHAQARPGPHARPAAGSTTAPMRPISRCLSSARPRCRCAKR
jgi:2-oxoglutarate/2-oxoacid ferredoxin oxidoreductase subunit alpha